MPKCHRHITLAAGSLAAILFARWARAGTYVWKGGMGEWSDGANWVGGTAPSRNTDDIQIDGGNPVASVVTNDNQIGGAGSLAIDAGDTLSLGETCVLSIGGPVTINGTLNAQADSWFNLRLPFDANPATLTIGGTGRVTLDIASQLAPLRLQDSIEIGPGLLVQAIGTQVTLGSRATPGSTPGGVFNAGVVQSGSDGVDSAASIDIPGTLQNTGTLRAAGPGFISTDSAATNTIGGFMEATGGGALNMAGPFTNDGTIHVAARGELAIAGQATNRGSIQLDPGGFLIMAGGDLHSPTGLNLTTGNLVGNGTVTADVRLGGTAAPGYGDVGSLTIAGNLTLTGGAHYAAELSGTAGADLLQIHGNLDLSAADDVLDLQDLGGLALGDNFVIATYTGALIGAFDQVTPGYLVSYDTPGEIAVTVVPEPAGTLATCLAAAAMLRRRRTHRAHTHALTPPTE